MTTNIDARLPRVRRPPSLADVSAEHARMRANSVELRSPAGRVVYITRGEREFIGVLLSWDWKEVKTR